MTTVVLAPTSPFSALAQTEVEAPSEVQRAMDVQPAP